jgi:hypothetical protein
MYFFLHAVLAVFGICIIWFGWMVRKELDIALGFSP